VGNRFFRKAGLLLLICLLIPLSVLARDSVSVTYVIDGDTVILKSGENVRYIGIDTPEIDHENKKAEPLGYAARSFNQTLLRAQGIRLEFDREKRDHYNRLLAYVFLPDGTFVNLELLRSGLGTYLHKPPNLKYAEALMQAQRKAMSGKRGVWQTWSETGQTYVGNRRSKRFHIPSCPYGKNTAPANRVEFSRQWDAYWHGYAPCKKCFLR
jgi:micrococcal nuclease